MRRDLPIGRVLPSGPLVALLARPFCAGCGARDALDRLHQRQRLRRTETLPVARGR